MPQESIDRISRPIVTLYGTREANILYTAPNFTLNIDYLLTGGEVIGLPGETLNSDLAESIRIVNTSARTLEFHLFQYSHADLSWGLSMDTIQIGRNLRGLFNEGIQWSPFAALSDTVTTPGASHGEVNFAPELLERLNNISGYNLNDNGGPLGPGDVAYALQWDWNIAPGAGVLISMDSYLPALIPEPSGGTLLVFALGWYAARRKLFR